MEHWFQGYLFSTDPSRLQMDAVDTLMKQSYWAPDRSMEKSRKAAANSVCYGIYAPDGKQIGYARVITDHATTYYVCDVIVDQNHRGHGLGKELLKTITGDFAGLMGMLLTRDAHGLYEKYGFERDGETFMMKP